MCTLGCTEGALIGSTKAEFLKTRWYVLLKTKTCRIMTEVLQFYATCIILCLLLRIFFKLVGELHLLTLCPKLIFWGALKKVLMFTEVRFYQTQYFTKTFPNPLSLTVHIHFYLHLQLASENTPWIVIVLESATFSAPKSAPETTLESIVLC